ncbi:MAG: NAD(P)-binding protein, partial [Candidatus Firestonebacteria bacterium]
MKKKIAILGGGLAGLSAAFHLRKSGKDFLLFEKEERTGGLSASFTVNKFSFDYTGHYLHFKTNYGKELVSRFLGKNIKAQDRKAAVYISGEYIPYPFQVNYGRLKNKKIVSECEKGLANLKSPKKKKIFKTFKDWILGMTGEGVAKHFMLPYNEKLYKSDLGKILPSGPVVYIPDIKEKKKAYGYNAKFFYPKKGGIGLLAKAINEKIFDRVLLCARVTSIKGSTLNFNNSRSASGFDSIISTIPLPELIPLLKGAPKKVLKAAKNLKYVSVFALNLGIGRAGINKNHWIYFPDPKVSFYRVGFYSNVSRKLCPPWTSSLYAEVSVKQGEKFNVKALAGRIKKDLIK